MNISVILCTYNRCQSLSMTLESLASSTLPDSVEWQVLVVNNNSTDHTREVVEDFCRRYPDLFRYVFESQPGKSFALNTGVRLLSAEERLWYEPSAIVYHAVPANRIQQKYFLKWWFDKARADIRAFGIPSDTKWFVVGIPLYPFRRMASRTLRWMVNVSPSGVFPESSKSGH
jgi:cellulose synthase/poly-beta-1,6-N-acetylglucosamine synthase-like glycosyltransferase